MATYRRFEELPVWRSAAELYNRVEHVFRIARPCVSFAFRNQMERAVLSISNNIAEGFERGTTKEMLTFIYIARGSAGEVRSMLTLLSRRTEQPPGFQKAVMDANALTESCSRQLRGWAVSLQRSDIDGQRHLSRRATTSANLKSQIPDFKGAGTVAQNDLGSA